MKLHSVFPLNSIITANDQTRKNPKTIMNKNYHFSKTSIALTAIAIILVWYTSMPIIAHADSLVATIPVGSKPYVIAYGNGNIYVTNYFGNTVSVISGATNTVVNTIPVGSNPIGVAYGNGNIYVANFMGNTVTVISGATNTVVNTIPVGVHPFGVAFNSANGNIYVTNYSDNSVSVISGATNTVVNTIPVGNSPNGVAFDSANGNIYVTNIGGNTVSVISGATNTVVNTIPVGFNPIGIAFDSANGNIYVANYGANTVSVISGATNTVVNTIPVGAISPIGSKPYGIAYGIGNIYVANFMGNTVSVINGTTNTVVNTIPVGVNPSWVAFDSANVNVNVANFGSDTVSVIKPTLTVPAAPAGFTATAVSPTQINLSWTAPSNTGGSPITGYKIEVKIGTGTYSVLTANTANATTTYSHTGLTAITSYTYRVSAINAVGTSIPSAEAPATTPVLVTVPTLTVKSATGGGLVKFTTSAGGFTSLTAIPQSSLSPPPPLGSYPLGFFSWSITGFAPATSITVTITYPNAVPPGSQYLKLVGGLWVSMPITNSGNTTTMTITDNGPYDADPTVGVISDPGGLLDPKPPATVPAAPAGLTAIAVNATQINLSWTTPSNGGSSITGYKVEYKFGSAAYSTLTTISGNATTSYSHTALIPSTAYTYRVSAINVIGTSTPSAEASATTPALVTVPAAPAGLTATAVSPTQINLSWITPSNTGGSTITGYKIEVKNGTLGTYSVLAANTASTTTTYSHTALIPSTAYTYRVSAINVIGTSTPSAEASATTPALVTVTAPAAPAGLTATPVSLTQINLAWSAPSNGGSTITGYKIEYKVGLGAYSTLTTISGNATTTYSHTGLTAATSYTYRVSAINAVGTSIPSAEASATTQAIATVPAAPTGLTATAISSSQINLSWAIPSNGGSPITGYKIEVKIGTLGTYSVLATNTATTTYSHTGLTAITSYTYRVSAINAVGTSIPSAEASTTLTKAFNDLVLSVSNFHLSANDANTLAGEVNSAENSLKVGDVINEQIQIGNFENSVRSICCDNPPFKPLTTSDQNELITNAENIIHNSKP